jgi:hypothetical protein
MHSTNDLNDGYVGSGKRLWNSIRKYGKENHKIDILEFYDNRTILRSRERDIIDEELLKNPFCMNIRDGGDGGWYHIKELRYDPVWMKNKNKKISNAVKLAYKEGRVNIRYDCFYDWTGKKHKSESIEKMKYTHKLNGHQQGEKNSCYGTCWIYNTNEKCNKKIKKEELNGWISRGWIKGRKMKF